MDEDDRSLYDELHAKHFADFPAVDPLAASYSEQMFQAKWRRMEAQYQQILILDAVVASHPPGHFGDDDLTPIRVQLEARKNPRFRRLLDHEDTQTFKHLRALFRYSNVSYGDLPAPKQKTTNEPTLQLPYVAPGPPQAAPPQQHKADDPPQPPPCCRPRTNPGHARSWVQTRENPTQNDALSASILATRGKPPPARP